MTVEMKIAEVPTSEDRLKVILTKQVNAKAETETRIKELHKQVEEGKKKVAELTAELEVFSREKEEGQESRKRKFGEEDADADLQGQMQETQEV